MLQLLRGAGLVLALEEALVDNSRNVLHFVFAHPSRCVVRGRQFCRRSLRNDTGVLGNVVHVLGDIKKKFNMKKYMFFRRPAIKLMVLRVNAIRVEFIYARMLLI
jgi:hypothetical protein